ncbi:MAG: ISKra4 family transposase, partial [Candidatus Helarchaeota archaeon]|nr:ISKra4 family transposase [Candidatus Helarchaeota archaeon]
SVSVDSLERMNRQMAESVEAFRTSLKKPATKEEGEILVATADGKGIPMRRPSDQRPAGARRKKGEKANQKQMATIGCVYTVDPKIRTAEEVVEALFRERPRQAERKMTEPVAQQKRVWSSLSYHQGHTHVEAEPTVFGWMAGEVASRRRPGQLLACVMDGQRSLWAARKKSLPGEDIVEVLDLLHVTSRLWDAAYLFHAEGSDQAADFVRDRVLRVLRGEAGYVIGGLRQMGTKHRLPASKRRKLSTICNYFKRNQKRMRYNQYLAKGLPIASGVIEGACRHVIKDRMERAGMRWTVAGAQAMLDLRSTYINDQWNPFQAHRIHRERQRLYPQREVLKHLTWSLAT